MISTHDAARICRNYAKSLRTEKPDWSMVALECAILLEEEPELVLTNFLVAVLICVNCNTPYNAGSPVTRG